MLFFDIDHSLDRVNHFFDTKDVNLEIFQIKQDHLYVAIYMKIECKQMKPFAKVGVTPGKARKQRILDLLKFEFESISLSIIGFRICREDR